jgi:hypothetical protein
MENNGTSMCLVYIAFGYLLETFLLLVPILLIFDDFLLRDFASDDMKEERGSPSFVFRWWWWGG